jgi:hypothetical protein
MYEIHASENRHPHHYLNLENGVWAEYDHCNGYGSPNHVQGLVDHPKEG